ncbi:MAG TPA: ADP-glyceromanno-heptose 6-epimerase [Bryobacteraceae bacterium]|jgi:ADP-L-glycero-D-manno-heptose 6-epimerase|nr:ADP-glyceromanno-heptose 6-epimerase [Bryobacteraceae bacterium]
MTDLFKGRILVTGGAGFIGSALIWELNRRGITDILVADFLGEEEKWRNLNPLRFADYLEADDLLIRLDISPRLFEGVTTIFHLGACSSTTETNAAYLIRNNFEYTKALAEFAMQENVRFVYASSAATYGSLESKVSESIPLESLRPHNMYGYSKHLFDSYAQRSGILDSITGVKYFNIFGPNEKHKGDMRSVVHKAFYQILETGQVSLFKSYRPDFRHGEQQRDFLYVKDAVAATIYLAENVDGGGLFNVGSGEANTWLTLAKSIFSSLGQPPTIKFIEMPDELQEGYQYYTCADISKLREVGFTQSMTSLPDAVRDYVLNYLIPDRHLGDEPSQMRVKSPGAFR